jgi:hypothetical protein
MQYTNSRIILFLAQSDDEISVVNELTDNIQSPVWIFLSLVFFLFFIRIQISNKMTCKFSIDASNLGHGNLEIDITCNGQYVPHQVRPLGNRKFEVSFMPKILSTHYANVKLNGIFINGKSSPTVQNNRLTCITLFYKFYFIQAAHFQSK